MRMPINPPYRPNVWPIPYLAMIGDSRIANGKSISGSNLNIQMHGVGSWVQILSKGKVLSPPSANLAVSGSTLTSHASDGVANAKGIVPANGTAGQLAEVLALNPRPSHCLILTGTNDIALAIQTVAQMQQTQIAVWQQLRAAGIIPVQLLDLPRAWTTTARRAGHFAWNTWLLQNGSRYGAVIIDATPVLQDIANSSGDPLTSLYYDSPAVHPNNPGCYAVGNLVANYFDGIAAGTPFKGMSRGDTYDATNNTRGNLLPNGGVMSGTGGTKTGTNVTGSVADGMKVELISGSVTSCACSVSARADGGAGNWQVIDLTTSGAASIWFYPASDITIAGGNIAVGEMVDFAFDFEASGITANVTVNGRLINFQNATVLNTYFSMLVDNTKGALPAAYAGRPDTGPMQIIASTTKVVPIVSITATGAVTNAILRVGGAELRKVA